MGAGALTRPSLVLHVYYNYNKIIMHLFYGLLPITSITVGDTGTPVATLLVWNIKIIRGL